MTIMGYQDHPISVRTSLDHKEKLCIVYPGFGYTLTCPIFFYLFPMLEMLKIDSYGIDLRYAESMKGVSQEEGKKWLNTDSQIIGDHVKEWVEPYKEAMFIGKSLGTYHMKNQIQQGVIRETDRLVWLTPADGIKSFYAYARQLPNRSLLIYGTADPRFSPEDAGTIISANRLEVMELPACGHSFEVRGNLEQSIENVKIVIQRIRAFLIAP